MIEIQCLKVLSSGALELALHTNVKLGKWWKGEGALA